MRRYTQEQITQANNTNLEEYLTARGEKLQRAGREFRYIYRDAAGEHESVSVRGNRWYDHKNQVGGYPIQFLQEFFGLTFREAMRELLRGEPEQKGTRSAAIDTVPDSAEKEPNEKYKRERYDTEFGNAGQFESDGQKEKDNQRVNKPLSLPEKSDNMKRLFAYLTKTRFLSRDVVKAFVDNKLLYQEVRYNNIVFVGTDTDGNAKCAGVKSTVGSFRQTLSGSDCSYGFCWRGTGKQLFVFEAAVDLMSFITLYPENWQEQNYIALDGLSAKPLLRFLDERQGLSEVYLCTDNDPAGIEAHGRLREQIAEHGYTDKAVFCWPPSHKDWNEQLKAQNGAPAIPAQPHPKQAEYHRLVDNLERLNRKLELPYNQWKAQQYEKGRLHFVQNHMVKEWRTAKIAADKQNEKAIPALEASILRITDLALYSLCKMQGRPYFETAWEVLKAYQPHRDKGKLTNRLIELKQEMDGIRRAEDESALFSCLKAVADAAIRTKVYLKLEYPLEMERRNRFREGQQLVESNKEAPAESEQVPQLVMQ